MKKGLVLSIFPAPYRVNVFKEMKESLKLDIFFERKQDMGRSEKFFYEKNVLSYKLLTETDDYASFQKNIKNLLQYEYVIIYDFSTKKAMKLMCKCIKSKVPYYINCDGAFINQNIIKYIIKKYFITHALGCFANGNHAKEYFLHYGAKEKNIFFHNFSTLSKKDILLTCLSANEKSLIKQKLNIENKKTVITVGRFIYSKGFDVLLNAWKEISSEFSLIILGGGENEKIYNEFIEANHLTNIKILDFKPFEEVLEYFKACDLFVLPTRSDVWGLVINEAMACGLPVITTDRCIAGLELVENEKNGYIVPVENHIELGKKMKLILENDILASSMGKMSLEKIRPYTIENIARSHVNVLEDQFKK